MRKKLFGNSVTPECKHCLFCSAGEDEVLTCKKRKKMKPAEKCRKYQYDPLKREPQVLPGLPDYDKEEFML